MSAYILQAEIEKGTDQTLAAMDKSLKSIFTQIQSLSDLIFFDPNMQQSLNAIDTKEINFKKQASITKSITNMLLSEEYISSVYLFDRSNNYYQSYRSGDYSVSIKNLTKAPWYTQVEELKGEGMIVSNSGGVIKKRNTNEMFISVIQNIMSVSTYQKIGTLIINVDEKKLQGYFFEIGKEYQSEFFIVDGNSNYIVRPTRYQDIVDQYLLDKTKRNKKFSVIKDKHSKFIISEIESTLSDWAMISITPITTNILTNTIRNALYIPVVVINFIFIFICAIYLTKLIFNPLHRMEGYMHLVEKGEFVKIPLATDSNDEIMKLKRGFNQMVTAIEKLIEEIKVEQRIIRKNELDLIQAQVNPHFLYNTLDAVSALNLIGDNERAYEVVQQLGNFYRNSLGSGRDMITIEEELDCIESYIAILNIRYDNKIKLVMDVEQAVMKLRILKLILQPIIENAVYHGIRYKHGQGTICIQGYRDDDEVIFIVTDDGMGMSEDKIEEVLDYRTDNAKKGFGVYSAMQRIALFYSIEKPITIISEPEWGTEITIRVKVMEEA
jgi:two-component system sensor histidine kinase YesM